MPNRHETLTSLFEDIADAIRAKTGDSAEIVADNFDQAIAAIPGGGPGPEPSRDDYFCVRKLETAHILTTITINFYGSQDDMPELYYSFDDQEDWLPVNFTASSSTNYRCYISLIPESNRVYFKNESSILSKGTSTYTKFGFNGDVKITGKLGSLINKINDDTYIYPYAFFRLLQSNANYELYCDELRLPKMTSTSCYAYMFGDSKLMTAPELPAEFLDAYCYSSMFNGCRWLTTAPTLAHVKFVDTYCCNSMFNGCASLTTAPVMPSAIPSSSLIGLASNCYAYMFSGCTSLTTAPALPVMPLATYCYNSMFENCTSLTTAPALPVKRLASNCYNGMFRGCTSLTTVPVLPATALESSCYAYMFDGCSSLKVYTEPGEGHMKAWNIPGDGPLIGTTRAQSSMLRNVQTDSVPANFPGVPGTQYTYYTEFDPVE